MQKAMPGICSHRPVSLRPVWSRRHRDVICGPIVCPDAEAHDLAERWEEDEPVEGWVCDTELKRLLQAHNELGVDIVTLDDEDYGEDDDEPAG
jgi:hypothetical protein